MLGVLVSFIAACVAVLGTEAWNDLADEDERKRLMNDVIKTVVISTRWFLALPVISWIHRRLAPGAA
jgi:hypothetical protein